MSMSLWAFKKGGTLNIKNVAFFKKEMCVLNSHARNIIFKYEIDILKNYLL